MGRKNEELTGVWASTFQRFQAGTPDQVLLGNLKDGVTVKVGDEFNRIEAGMEYRFFGRWLTHDRYGKQFHANSFVIATPASEQGVVRYLEKANGIGRRRAQQLWNLFGAETLEIFRTNPQKIHREMPGLSLEICQAASELFTRLHATEAVTLDLEALLGSQGFPRHVIGAAIRVWGARAAETIRENPFVLMDFRGVGFLKCDKLYQSLGLPMGSLHRMALCAWYAIASDGEGHTWLPKRNALVALNSGISGCDVNVHEVIEFAKADDLLRERNDDEGDWLACSTKADAESWLVSNVHQAIHEIDDSFGLPDAGKIHWPNIFV